MVEKLSIFSLGQDGSKTPFPNNGAQAVIADYQFVSGRMGSISLSATLMYPRCLDNEWDETQFVEFRGEKYYIFTTPSSSKSNTDLRWKHDLVFTSERIQLDNTYFYDAVSPDAANIDQYVSNSTKFTFYGDINEFAKRMNYSLKYSGLKYSIVVDEGISSEGKLMTFEDKFFSEVLQLVFETYELPYYFAGRVIHIGFSSNAITQTFKYGHDNQLLSITKTNANYRIINRCTGVGSDENIPYYYPNDNPKGDIGVQADANNTAIKQADIRISDKDLFAEKVNINETIEYREGEAANAYSYNLWSDTGMQYQYTLKNQVEIPRVEVINTVPKTGVWKGTIRMRLKMYREGKMRVGIQPLMRRVWKNANPPTKDWQPEGLEMKFSDAENNNLTYTKLNTWDYSLGDLAIGEYNLDFIFPFQTNEFIDYYKVYAVIKAISIGYDGKYWFLNNAVVSLPAIGISITKTPAVGDKFKQIELKTDYIPYAQNLMPPIYRESKGLQHFYNAKNNTYKIPGTNEYYTFENEYTEGNPKEIIVKFENIKPSIKGVRNAAGQLIGEIAAIAFDDEDNDELDKKTNAYLHPYFYVKLRKTDGTYGFNLFEQGISSGEMTLSMTSGKCAACNFIVEVKEEGEGEKAIFQNPVQVDSNGNIVPGNAAEKINKKNIQERQQNTRTNEVWLALKKDDSTFNIVMPNETNNYKPEAGDSFVILNIKLPQAYILSAENDLKEEIIRYMAQNNSEKFNFSITFSRIYLENHPDILAQLNENARLQIEYNSQKYELYVSNYTYKVSNNEILPEITVELSDTITIRKGTLQKSISAVQQSLLSTIGSIDFLKMGLKYFLRKDVPDTALEHITFNDGILVRGKNAIIEESANVIYEEDGNAIYEEYSEPIMPIAEANTLGSLDNVDVIVDGTVNDKVLLVKNPGSTQWTQEKMSINVDSIIYISTQTLLDSTRTTDLTLSAEDHQAIIKLYGDKNVSKNTVVYRGKEKLGNQYLVALSMYANFSIIPASEEGVMNVAYVNPSDGFLYAFKIKTNENRSIATVPGKKSSGGGGGGSVIVDSSLSTTSVNPVQNRVITAALNSKQNTLVSGTNIKTINSQSIVGSGNVNLTYSFSQITSKPTTLSGYGISDAYTMTQVNNAFVSLSGNVIRTSGKLSMAADVFADDGSTGGLDMRNSNIVGVNGIYFKDASDSDGEYINFYRDSTHVDSLYALNGELRFKPNRVLGAITTASNIILHTGNYTSYVPTKTGTGATGTWAISITGTAELSKATNLINGSYTGSGGKQPPSYIPSGKIRFNMMSTVVGTDSNYKDFILMDSYTGNDVPYVTAIGVRKTSTPEAYIMSGAKGNTTEANWVKTTLLSALNYNNYAPSKTGLGASGTWNINVSGSAASVAWVNVSNKPNFAAVATSGSYNDLTNKPTITNITVDSALSTTSTNPLQNKIITTALNGKQANLVSGTNIKTVGGQSLLGSGNIAFPTITVDSALSSTSTNPLQNKVINSQIESVTTGMQLIMSLYNEIKTSALTSSSVVTSITTENSNSTSLVTSVKSIVSYINDNLIVPITPLLTAYLAQNTKNGMLILDSNGKVPSNLLPGTLLTLGTTSTTAFRGDYGNILFTNFGSGTNLTGTQRARNFFGKIDVSNLHFLSGDYTWTQTDSEIEIEFEQYNFTGTKSTSSPLINFPIATTAKAGLLGGDQCSYLVSLNTEYNNIANKANYIKARKFFNSINPVNEYYYCRASVSPSKIDIEIEIAKRNFDTSSETYDYINLPAVTLNNAGILTSTQFTNLSNKQEKLVSGTSIKTINGQSLLGSGNINISGGGLNSYTTTLDIFNISNGRTITSTEFAEVGRIVTAVREGKQILYNYQMAEFGTGVLNCHLADDLTCLSWVVTSYTDTEIFYINPTLSTDKWARISLVKSDFSNITSKSFGSSSSYYKLPDGLLIQWGYSTNSGIGKVIYYPISFFNTYYSVHLTGTRSVHSNYMYSFDIYTKSVSSFTMDSVYHNNDSDNGGFSISFYWFAIGRWK